MDGDCDIGRNHFPGNGSRWYGSHQSWKVMKGLFQGSIFLEWRPSFFLRLIFKGSLEWGIHHLSTMVAVSVVPILTRVYQYTYVHFQQSCLLGTARGRSTQSMSSRNWDWRYHAQRVFSLSMSSVSSQKLLKGKEDSTVCDNTWMIYHTNIFLLTSMVKHCRRCLPIRKHKKQLLRLTVTIFASNNVRLLHDHRDASWRRLPSTARYR